MPVPDEFVIAPDFTHCEMCDKCYPDNQIVHVKVDNDKQGVMHEVRHYAMCKFCREKCRTDSEYEKYVTDKVFSMNLGRRMK